MPPAQKIAITGPPKANPFEPAVASKMLAIPIHFGESGRAIENKHHRKGENACNRHADELPYLWGQF